jgi:ribosomal protein S18 acetylase RimI-like enzyme
MIRYRAFLNTDAPALVSLWNSQEGRRALRQPLTVALLEEYVFGKPFFDRQGLLVAELDGRVVGFAHAGWGVHANGSELSTEEGAVYLVVVAEHPQREAMTGELFERAEAYLVDRGAHTLWAGCVRSTHGFYLGLYGGSESPGVLESDAAGLALFRSAGYIEVERYCILQRGLAGFRPPIDRQQLQLRRQFQVESEANPPCASWWEAWTMGAFDRTRQRLFQRGEREACGSVLTWGRERLFGNSDRPVAGLMELQIREDLQGRGLGTFLVGETLRAAQAQDVSQVEIQVPEDHAAALALFGKLGFQQVDRGWVMRKNL